MILKSQLEKIILEEAEKVLSERALLRAISHHLTEEQIRNIRETGEIPEELIEGLLDSIRKIGAPLAFTLAMLQLPSAMAADITSADIQSATSNTATATAMADFADEFKGEDIKAKRFVQDDIEDAYNKAKDNLIAHFSSEQVAKNYASLEAESGAPGLDTDQDALDYYNGDLEGAEKGLLDRYIDIINDTPVLSTAIMDQRSQIPNNILAYLTDNENVGGLFVKSDTPGELGLIVFNPASYVRTGEFDEDMFYAMAMEELIHAVVETITIGELLPGLSGESYAGLQGAASKLYGKIMSGPAGALADDWQSHIQSPSADAAFGELYAKVMVIKVQMHAHDEDPENLGPKFFDDDGRVNPDMLKDLINNPGKYDLDLDEKTKDALKVFKPDSPRLGPAFDIIAKTGGDADNRAMA